MTICCPLWFVTQTHLCPKSLMSWLVGHCSELWSNHGGYTCVAAPLSIIRLTLLWSCVSCWAVAIVASVTSCHPEMGTTDGSASGGGCGNDNLHPVVVIVCLTVPVICLVIGVEVASVVVVDGHSALLGHVSWLSTSVANICCALSFCSFSCLLVAVISFSFCPGTGRLVPGPVLGPRTGTGFLDWSWDQPGQGPKSRSLTATGQGQGRRMALFLGPLPPCGN